MIIKNFLCDICGGLAYMQATPQSETFCLVIGNLDPRCEHLCFNSVCAHIYLENWMNSRARNL